MIVRYVIVHLRFAIKGSIGSNNINNAGELGYLIYDFVGPDQQTPEKICYICDF